MAGVESQTVATDRGTVRGAVEGKAVCFRGIPYAASPIDDLRFAPPRQHPGWTDVRDAVRSGPAVPQGPSRLERVMGRRVPDWNEDGCLTLNVFCPSNARDDARPVLVWFHGGGFTSGSGGWDWYDGALLAALGDIVVVTANYRVGPLGYLYLPEIGADNLGLQDQGAVLRWVHDNIAEFGGDPDVVTVGGQSAGAYSAMSLALDESTSGLVTRVLLESGPWGLPPQDPQNAAQNAETYLSLLDVPGGPDAGKWLRALPAEQLLSAYGQLAAHLGRPGNVAPPMYPVVGGTGVPAAWDQGLGSGALHGKAVLIGTTRDETTAFFGFDPRIQDLTAAGALDVLTEGLGGRAKEAYQRHAAQLPNATPAQIFTAVQTDAIFRDGALEIAAHHAAGGNPAYVYQFDRAPADDEHALGATHCSELPFLFGTFDAYPDSAMLGQPGDAERALGQRLASAVAQFVAAGSISEWPDYSTGHVQYLT
ncbi:carboxylesterase/lipase family protein [Mycolicibacterium sp. P9-64]|nr:carboxylesterase/lipase family protein [Mycolicibacterium sp. P9-64]